MTIMQLKLHMTVPINLIYRYMLNKMVYIIYEHVHLTTRKGLLCRCQFDSLVSPITTFSAQISPTNSISVSFDIILFWYLARPSQKLVIWSVSGKLGQSKNPASKLPFQNLNRTQKSAYDQKTL